VNGLCKRASFSIAAILAAMLGNPSIVLATSLSGDGLPGTMVRENGAAPERPTRGWSIRDIVEISAIAGIAVAQQPRQIGFVIRQPSLDSGAIRYGLYVIDVDGSKPARKILEAPYIAELSRNPNEHAWTALADLGSGVQIYDIDDSGACTPLVVNDQTVATGTFDGVIQSVYEPLRTGILSYEWSPDGASLWYSRPRLRSPAELQSFVDQGIPYDDLTMGIATLHQHAGELLGVEMHVLTRSPVADRTVAFAPSSASSDLSLMHREFASAWWAQDSRHVLYTTYPPFEDGKNVPSGSSVDVETGRSEPIAPTLRLALTVPNADGTRYLSVLRTPDGVSHLAEYGKDGRQISEGGKVSFNYVGLTAGWGAWRDADGRSEILAVRYADRYGLIRIPESAASRVWSTVKDNISACSFSGDLSFGACVRENHTLPPELVLVDTDTGALRTLVRPNARYDSIAPLRIEHASWKNRYGNQSDGYITYPRGFSPTQKYPAIVVTHGASARNEFVYRGFQAEIPIQVLAEAGYVVLSVNEVPTSLRTRSYLQERDKGATRSIIAHTQFDVITDPVATMEAALEDVITRGIVDPDKTGIAGYSRGAEIALYAMTQSKMFRAASIGDGGSNTNADGYWSWGHREAAAWYTSVYGGSAYDSDPKIRENYRRFSPAFRAKVFAGPLLEQCTANQASFGLEKLVLLRQAGIPVELDFFPHESHIFWHPRRSAAAMQRNVDWFDYWLLGKRNPSKIEQYERWQAMADIYEARQSKNVGRRNTQSPPTAASR